ncbi:MAG: hypothetical protein ACM3ZR_12305 [Pseudomonadota bacterium]
MIRKRMFSIILIFIILVSMTACSDKQNQGMSFNIPEAEKLQKVLEDISQAVMTKNEEIISNSISEDCPNRKLELKALKELMDGVSLKSYSQSIVDAKRLKDGVICAVNISMEGTSGDKDFNRQEMRNVYFTFKNATWKVADYNYHPYMNPTVVVGSESPIYDAAYSMSEALSSTLRADTEHLQSYGDIILAGTPYDNASILDLEDKGLTMTKVTEDYPGGSLGIVQVLSNVEDYRHVIIIQGSNEDSAEAAVRYMSRYLQDNPYINPGVYLIEDNALRPAAPLELTSLITLDMDRASERLREVQKQIEANIPVIEEELAAEKEQLGREQRYVDNKYQKDYSRYFSRYEFYPEHSPYDSMVMINSNLTDSRLCTSAFRLPYGNSLGTAYTYADYIHRNLKLSGENYDSSNGPLLGGNAGHTLSARELAASGNDLEITCLGTALLRLSGFSETEAYNATTTKGTSVFLNIGPGYSIAPGSPVVRDSALEVPDGKLLYIYNDGAFLDYDNSTTNLDSGNAASISEKTSGLYKLSSNTSGKAPEKSNFGRSELSEPDGIPYGTEEIYNLLRNTYPPEDSPCTFSTLEEAKEQLRSAMGRLLAEKCTRYLVNTAGKYPLSQYDFARYAAGLINVENPMAYAEAAESSVMVKDLSGGISNILSDSSERINKITEALEDISDEEGIPDRFYFPDYCLSSSSGSHSDKALLAYGLYSRLTGSTDDTYIALGESSSYLVYKEDDQWKFLDCKYNTLRDFPEDDIYAVFNKDFVYNKNLEIGYLPDFMK